jgi:transcriptional antiterminator RfaH
MGYWAVARLEPKREAVAEHFLQLAGYTVYVPQVREHRARNGRKVEKISPLFPCYGFILIEQQWHSARWTVGVAGIILNGDHPAAVADSVVDALRRRERNGAIELPKVRGLMRGDLVRVIGGAFTGSLALYQGMRPHQRVEVLLAMLGGQQRVSLPRSDIAALRTA